jgi:hypothetical protein
MSNAASFMATGIILFDLMILVKLLPLFIYSSLRRKREPGLKKNLRYERLEESITLLNI